MWHALKPFVVAMAVVAFVPPFCMYHFYIQPKYLRYQEYQRNYDGRERYKELVSKGVLPGPEEYAEIMARRAS